MLMWTPEALNDRLAIYEFIEADDPAAAIFVDELFAKGAAQLQAHPMSGRPGRIAGTRELAVHRHYVLVYDLSSDGIRILRVLDTAQQWPAVNGR